MNSLLAVLSDSIRLLRARKLFWVSLVISLITALMYLSVGFDEKGVTFLFGTWAFENPMLVKGSVIAEQFYTGLFTTYIIGLWLTWIAIALALISCAPIFPEFMLEGAAGVTLSKPISRLALFFYKYLGGLLFVIVQTVLFAIIVVIAIRWRLGYWAPSILWSVPLVTLVFSYLFSVQTLIGVKTRSVMFSILGTILFWFMSFSINSFDEVAYMAARENRNPLSFNEALSAEGKASWEKAYRWSSAISAISPKTSQTTAILNRVIKLKSGKSVQETKAEDSENEGLAARTISRNSIGYVIGSSLGFELVMLGLAAWIFTRRDF